MKTLITLILTICLLTVANAKASDSVFLNSNSCSESEASGDVLIFSGNTENADSGGIYISAGFSSGAARGAIIIDTDADKVQLNQQPTGAEATAVATTYYVDGKVVYTPANSSDYNSSPANCQQALDELAARVKALEE